ncbi:MAG TPA: hypothetical protein VFZ49_06775 [Pyrinomonadaceae bacterium]
MAIMGPMEYARKYWNLEFPILNDNNEIVGFDRVRFAKYRLHNGAGKDAKEPPGLSDFRSAVVNYAYGFFKQGRSLEMKVKNVWGDVYHMGAKTSKEFQPFLVRAVQAFYGKGSPEDVQLTLQLAVRCGVITNGVQQYCDHQVDKYARLGLDCNGFVGNYLRYRNSVTKWNYYDKNSRNSINGETMIRDMCTSLGTKMIGNTDEMSVPQVHVLGRVDSNGTVINQYSSDGIAHVMITQAQHWGRQDALPPIPKEYVGRQYLRYSGVESTPDVGLSDFQYTILNVAKNGVATVWRDKVFSSIKAKIYPVK